MHYEEDITYATNLNYIGIHTLREFITQTVIWMLNTPILAFICISLPFSSSIVKNSMLKFINPLILAIILILLMMSQYVPPLFAIGNAGPLRAENVRFMLFCVFMWGFFINLYGWYYQQQKNSIHVSKLIATILTIITLSISINNIPINETWSNKAFDHMWGKQIVALNNEMEKRIKYVKENGDLLENYKEYACINDMIRPSDDMWWDEYVINYFTNKPYLR